MTNTETLRALPRKWRERAKKLRLSGNPYRNTADSLSDCADDLEQAISAGSTIECGGCAPPAIAAAPAAPVAEPIAKALAIVDKVSMFNGGYVADDLRKVEATLNACAAALRSYSKDKWGPVANYSDNYWYIAGEPWHAADALLQGHSAPAVEVDEARTRQIITETIGFDFEDGELQTVNADDLLRLAAALGREGGGNG